MICNHCGTRNSDENAFCSNCGTRLVIPETSVTQASSTQNGKAQMYTSAMKKCFDSKLFLSIVIVAGISFAVTALTNLQSLLTTTFGIVGAVAYLIGLLPSLLVFIGTLKIYSSARKGTGESLDNSGFKLISGVIIFYIVMMYIALAIAAIAQLLCLIVPLERVITNFSLPVAITASAATIIVSCLILFFAVIFILNLIYYYKLKSDCKKLANCFENGTPFKALSLYITVLMIIVAVVMIAMMPLTLILSALTTLSVPAASIPFFSSLGSIPTIYLLIAQIILRLRISKEMNAINAQE